MSMNPAARRPRADPLIWAIWLRVPRVFHKVKSWVLAGLFRAKGAYFGPGSVVRGVNYIHFGDRFYTHGNLWLEAVSRYRGQSFSPSIVIGANVCLSNGVHITCIESVTLGKNVLIGSGAYISDHNHGSYKGLDQANPVQPPAERTLGGGGAVVIGDNVWIGENVIVLGPVTIGAGAILAANAVVTRDIPANTIAAGVPARPLKRFDGATCSWVGV